MPNFLLVDVGPEHMHALLSQPLSDGLANALGSSSDDCCLPVQASHAKNYQISCIIFCLCRPLHRHSILLKTHGVLYILLYAIRKQQIALKPSPSSDVSSNIVLSGCVPSIGSCSRLPSPDTSDKGGLSEPVKYYVLCVCPGSFPSRK